MNGNRGRALAARSWSNNQAVESLNPPVQNGVY